MQDDGPASGAGHSAIRQAQHVFHALELPGDGDHARLRHPGVSDGARVFENEHRVFGHRKVLAVDPSGQLGGVLKDYCDAGELEQAAVFGCGCFQDGSSGREVSRQYHEGGGLVEWVGEGADQLG